MRRLELTGQHFGYATVVEAAGTSVHGKSLWRCICDYKQCGTTFIALGAELRSGHTKSCGCFSLVGRESVHGHRSVDGTGKQSEVYTLWVNIRQRCGNENFPHYDDYGGRGIAVCDRWCNSFVDFLADITSSIGDKPPLLDGYERFWSLDRINNNGNYEPSNVRWADPITQCDNRRPRRWWKRPEGAHEVPLPV